MKYSRNTTTEKSASIVVADLTIENITGAWYVVHVGIVGGVTGLDLPNKDFMIGPFEEIPLGRVTFPRKSQVVFSTDNSIDIGSCTPLCNLQTRRILSALALELFWRVLTGAPYPANESDKILFLAEKQVGDNPIVNLGVDIRSGDISALLNIVNDIPAVLADPVIGALLAAHGVPAALPGWLILYGRAAQTARLLIETLIYPNFGQLVFDAK